MKVGIPSMGEKGLDEQVGQHFGRVTHYTIVDLENDKVNVIQNTSHHMGGQGNPPELLAKEDVHTMICQGLGRRAISLFNDYNITVYIGATGTVRNAVTQFKNGTLTKANETDACGKHTFHDHHQH